MEKRGPGLEFLEGGEDANFREDHFSWKVGMILTVADRRIKKEAPRVRGLNRAPLLDHRARGDG